ncbi:MAG: gamma-butyrobetaine hydroxylase-like domain-containing protein [Colwellia sp.]
MKITHFIIDKTEKNLTVELSTGDETMNKQLSFEYLRISSPEHPAKKVNANQAPVISHKKNVMLVNIESVAKHGYRLIFDDDHSAIYSEEYIHTLALDYDLRWHQYLSNLKASGHSREATIEIKQL